MKITHKLIAETRRVLNQSWNDQKRVDFLDREDVTAIYHAIEYYKSNSWHCTAPTNLEIKTKAVEILNSLKAGV